MKDTFYFKHDNNARHDTKLVKLRMKDGWEGYGMFWAVQIFDLHATWETGMSAANVATRLRQIRPEV